MLSWGPDFPFTVESRRCYQNRGFSMFPSTKMILDMFCKWGGTTHSWMVLKWKIPIPNGNWGHPHMTLEHLHLWLNFRIENLTLSQDLFGWKAPSQQEFICVHQIFHPAMGGSSMETSICLLHPMVLEALDWWGASRSLKDLGKTPMSFGGFQKYRGPPLWMVKKGTCQLNG